MDIMNKILKSFNCGDSVVLPLTKFIKLGEEYYVHDEDDKVIIEPLGNFKKS